MSKKYTGYDFCGWATRNDIRCTDGRTIKRDAFAHQDGMKVPLVWGHDHDDPEKIVGHGFLENRDEGVYIYGYLNNGRLGRAAKEDIEHGDITNLSIWANHLKQNGGDVIHGSIKEVSLVLSGANMGATIEYPIIQHGDDYSEDYSEAFIYLGDEYVISHSDESEEQVEDSQDDQNNSEDVAEHSDEKGDTMPDSERTVKDVLNTLNEEQQKAVAYVIGAALESAGAKEVEHSDEGDNEMNFNAFDMQGTQKAPAGYISHDDMNTILKDAKTCGSLKEAVENHLDHGVLQHADDDPPARYGVEPIDYLFPEARSLNTPPAFIQRDMGWVSKVMGGVHKTPFSRIKSMFANITEEEARALGYIKGHYKKEEVFTLLKRTTSPQTIYKKQKFDRDDLIDITDFDMIAWIKREMRVMLDEELARSFLIGDGRLSSSDDKISESHIRPIMSDDDLFSIKVKVTPGADDNATAKAIVRAVIKARKDYKGSGNPTFFTTEDVLTDMLLIEDTTGRIIYDSVAKLANALRVSDIVTVPVMENVTGPQGGPLIGIIVNLNDYNVGADRGGEVNLFDDFDIDYNHQKYLIETRCSGALIKPFSAIVLEKVASGSTTTTYSAVTPEAGDDPAAEGWYEKASKGYMKTEDTTVRANKTYYEKSVNP